jgi:hypothetical protein
MMRPLAILALAATLAAAPAAAQNIGEEFRCPGADGPDVLAVIGRTDMLSELAGRDMDPHDVMIVHVQMVAAEGDAPALPHLALTEAALAECARVDPSAPFDRAAFDAGLDAFRAAVSDETAEIIQTDPAAAYGRALGEQEG